MHKAVLYKRGYCLLSDRSSTRQGGGIRGRLTGKVSSASFRRLRQFCITHDCFGDCWGVTLTVPGLDLLSVDDFKKLHHKLCVWANDNGLPLVWRVELQRRGQPHLHCVLFCNVSIVLQFFMQWYRLLDKLPCVYNMESVTSKSKDVVLVSRAYLSGASHAVEMQRLSGDFRAWRYLVAHMSKSKVEQLGWSGRNWGCCNRRLFRVIEGSEFDLDDAEFVSVSRWITRLTRGVPSARRSCRLNKFLEKKKTLRHYKRLQSGLSGIPETLFFGRSFKRVKSASFWLGDPNIMRRMIEYLRSNPPIPF